MNAGNSGGGTTGRGRLGRVVVLGTLFALGLPGGCVSRVDEGDTNGGGSGGSGGSGGDGGSGGYPYGCLSAGTRITTPEGSRTIEELAVGDRVVSLDHETGELRENLVTNVRRLHRLVGEVRIPGGRLLATEEHPFFDASRGRYIESAAIDAGTALVTLPHADAPALLRADAVLDSFVAEPYLPNVGEGDVYDLTVDRDHNYFAEGVLVHNKSGGSPPGGGGSGGASVAEGTCTRTVAETTPVVCSGPAAVGLAPNQGSPAWFTWDIPSGQGLGGEGNAAFGGSSSAGDTIVVAFEVCANPSSAPHWYPAFAPYVMPGQEVLVGVSTSGPCTAPEMLPVVANQLGALATTTGWVHVAVPLDEFECLYLATKTDPDLCAATAGD